MNENQFRREVLENRARSTENFVGKDSRPDLLQAAMSFKPEFSRVGEVVSEQFRYRTGGSTPVRPFIGGARPVFNFTRNTYQQLVSNCDGSNPTDTQWIGYETGTGDITNASPTVLNATGGNPTIGDKVTGSNIPINTTISNVVGTTLTLSHNATATTAGSALRYTGNAHAYPDSVNGSWQFGLDMWPLFTPSGLITPGTIAASNAITGKIEILDQASAVLLTATRQYTMTQTGPGALSCTLSLDSDSEPTTALTQFYGVKFTITGGSFNIGSNWNLVNQLIVLDPSDLVVDKTFP